MTIYAHLFNFSIHFKRLNLLKLVTHDQFVLVEYAGNVQFSPQLHISHVLYSPLFKMNLISVFKLCASLPCHVNFSDSI